ncbi:hypothetical protein BC629DRAFT_498431 [Irpex lacteus]|nr:hypothetical protein BC629DRAFT_498431 [Irpex lacteus]
MSSDESIIPGDIVLVNHGYYGKKEGLVVGSHYDYAAHCHSRPQDDLLLLSPAAQEGCDRRASGLLVIHDYPTVRHRLDYAWIYLSPAHSFYLVHRDCAPRSLTLQH